MSSELAVDDKALLYSGDHNHHLHRHQPIKPPPPTSPPQQAGAPSSLDDEDAASPMSADETDEVTYYNSQAATAPAQHLQMGEPDELPDDDQQDEEQHLQDQDHHHHQHQQYSSLLDHHQQRHHQQSSSILLHHRPHQHQHHLLPTLPPDGVDSIIKSEAASNGSEDKEEEEATADFCNDGPSDYGEGPQGSMGRDNMSTVVRTRRRKAGLAEDERICAVCGDPASGYNFDRLTCESCKAFFRRNALKSREKIKPCSRGGGCDVSGSQRKHCPTCRLEKCLSVGMKKELILPPEKLEQRAKPKKRIKNGSGGGGGSVPGGTAGHAVHETAAPPQAKRSSQHSRVAGAAHHHHQQHQLHHQHPAAALHPSNGGVDLDPPLLGHPERHLQHHQQQLQPPLYSQHLSSQRRSSSPSLSFIGRELAPPLDDLALAWAAGTSAGRRWPHDLTQTDRECLGSLEDALGRVRETLVSEEAGLSLKDGIGRLEQAFNQMDACIRRIISVVKLIPIFSDVEKDSQILMLKVNIYGLVILYSSFFFNPATGAWEMPIAQQSGSRSISLMQELAASVAAIIEMRPDVSELTLADLEQYRANTDNVYTQLERFSRRDDLVKMLMLALKLFNSDTMPAEVRGPIDEAQSVYSQLLKKYLAYKFGVPEAMQMYPRLLMTFIDMRTVENKMTEFTKLLSVESLNPLVREVTQVN